MRIYWGLKRSRERVAADIAELEREVGFADAQVLEVPKRDRPGYRPRLLEDSRYPMVAGSTNYTQVVPAYEWKRELAQKVLYGDGQPLVAASCARSYAEVTLKPRPRIELPPGVTLR